MVAVHHHGLGRPVRAAVRVDRLAVEHDLKRTRAVAGDLEMLRRGFEKQVRLVPRLDRLGIKRQRVRLATAEVGL